MCCVFTIKIWLQNLWVQSWQATATSSNSPCTLLNTLKGSWITYTWLSAKDTPVQLSPQLEINIWHNKGTEPFTQITPLGLSVFLLWPVATQLRHVAGDWCFWQPVSWMTVSRCCLLRVLFQRTEVQRLQHLLLLHLQLVGVCRVSADFVPCSVCKTGLSRETLGLSAALLQQHVWVLLRIQKRLCGLGPWKNGLLRLGAWGLTLVTIGGHHRRILNSASCGVSHVPALIAVRHTLARWRHAGRATNAAAVLLRQILVLL